MGVQKALGPIGHCVSADAAMSAGIAKQMTTEHSQVFDTT